IECLGFTATPGWRSTATVEEGKIYFILTGDPCKIDFGFVDRPIGHKISSVFGTIGEAEHDGLPSPFRQMLLIDGVCIKRFHDLRRPFQVVDRFKQRNEVDRQVVECPSTSQEELHKLKNVGRLLAVADNESMGSKFAPCALHLLNIPDGFESIDNQRV